MAETAMILSPKKTVVLPESAAGCLMADMINAYDLQQLQAKHPTDLPTKTRDPLNPDGVPSRQS